MSFRLRHFVTQCLRSFQSKQCNNEGVPTKKGSFWSFRLDDCLMTSQKRKLSIIWFQYTGFSQNVYKSPQFKPNFFGEKLRLPLNVLDKLEICLDTEMTSKNAHGLWLPYWGIDQLNHIRSECFNSGRAAVWFAPNYAKHSLIFPNYVLKNAHFLEISRKYRHDVEFRHCDSENRFVGFLSNFSQEAKIVGIATSTNKNTFQLKVEVSKCNFSVMPWT